jgi:hypothetical protein
MDSACGYRNGLIIVAIFHFHFFIRIYFVVCMQYALFYIILLSYWRWGEPAIEVLGIMLWIE